MGSQFETLGTCKISTANKLNASRELERVGVMIAGRTILHCLAQKRNRPVLNLKLVILKVTITLLSTSGRRE
jgi:hypothetical protein